MSELTRCCKTCGITKPLSDFPSNPMGKDGKRSTCRICTNLAQRDKWHEKKTVPVEAPADTSKQCSACLLTKPIEEFPRRVGGQHGVNSRCRDCIRIEHRKERDRNGKDRRERYKGRRNSYPIDLQIKCCDCGEVKSITEFHTNDTYKYGVMPYCKSPCAQRRNQIRRDSFRETFVPVTEGERCCSKCKRVLPVTEFGARPEVKSGIQSHCKQCQSDYWRVMRMDVLSHYSDAEYPRCACCHESTYEFLTLDHIKGDGAEHRRQLGTNNVFRLLKRQGYPPGLQVLCWNCNMAKGKGLVCPHQRERESNECKTAGSKTPLP